MCSPPAICLQGPAMPESRVARAQGGARCAWHIAGPVSPFSVAPGLLTGGHLTIEEGSAGFQQPGDHVRWAFCCQHSLLHHPFSTCPSGVLGVEPAVLRWRAGTPRAKERSHHRAVGQGRDPEGRGLEPREGGQYGSPGCLLSPASARRWERPLCGGWRHCCPGVSVGLGLHRQRG